MKRRAGKKGKARAILPRVLLAAALALTLVLAGCVDARPVVTTATIPPDPTPTPTPTPEPTPEPTPTPTPTPGVLLDALGAVVNDTAHYEKYITFRNIAVYEQEDDTFIDLIAVNSYPESMICALGAVFYDETGELAASAQLQTRDGEYLLTLASGETTLYARVDTDTALTMMDISLVFDESVGVYPEK